MDPNFTDWLTAIAALLTASVAVAAVAIASGQLREARRLRREQAQPYVVAYMEASAGTNSYVDLVVRNFGNTAAFDVRMTAGHELQRSDGSGGVEAVGLFETLPTLVPGQEWRTFWDFGRSRSEADLPAVYPVSLRFRDSTGKELGPLNFVLDWKTFSARMWVQQYGLHEASKALRDIQQTLKRWSDGSRGIAVVARDGDDIDRRRREQAARARAEHEALTERLKPETGSSDDAGHPE